MERIINPGSTANGQMFLKIKFENKRLSITGVIGPLSNGDCRGNCGQIIDKLSDLHQYTPGYSPELCGKLREAWERWHLNDMRPGCEHQRAWDAGERLGEKLAGWTYPAEHPKGLLMKPCPDCGYKYGSAWLHEDVPGGVIEFLFSLPESRLSPAWV